MGSSETQLILMFPRAKFTRSRKDTDAVSECRPTIAVSLRDSLSLVKMHALIERLLSNFALVCAQARSALTEFIYNVLEVFLILQ